MSHREPLPFRTVNWLWEELTKVYGHQFLARWEGLDTRVIKEDWRHRLAGLSAQQLVFGVENLPAGRAPDVLTFRETCMRMPQPVTAALPPKRGPARIPEHVRPAIDLLLQPRSNTGEPYKVTVARRYLARWDGQQHLTPQQNEDLKHYRAIVERYEREDLSEAKAKAQRSVDEYQDAQP